MVGRAFLTFTASLTLLAAAIAPAAAQPADTDWPMYQYDLKHTGKTKVAGPGAGAQGVQTKWIYKSASWIKDQVAIGPDIGVGIPDKAVFFGDAKFPLCMVDPETGGPAIWCTDIGGFVNSSSPVVGNPNLSTGVQTVYIGDRNNVFWAVDSETHQPLWHWKIPLDGDVHGSGIINPSDGSVYVPCGCTTTGVLYKWDRDPDNIDSQGVAVPKWKVYIAPGIRYSQPAGVFKNSKFRIYIGTADGRLAAIDDNGSSGGVPGKSNLVPNVPNWSIKLTAKVGTKNVQATKNYHSSPTIAPDGTIYIGTNKGIFAVKDDPVQGPIVLSLFTGNAVGEWDTAFALDTVTMAPKVILYASVYHTLTRTLFAIDVTDPSNPKTFFKYGPFRGTTSTAYTVTPAPVVDKNGIVYAAAGPRVFAFNPATVNTASPQPAWSFTLANPGAAPGDAISLAVGKDVLYVAARDFSLYALEKQ